MLIWVWALMPLENYQLHDFFDWYGADILLHWCHWLLSAVWAISKVKGDLIQSNPLQVFPLWSHTWMCLIKGNLGGLLPVQ